MTLGMCLGPVIGLQVYQQYGFYVITWSSLVPVSYTHLDVYKRQEPVLVKSYLWDPTESMATRILMMTCWQENGMKGKGHLYFMHDVDVYKRQIPKRTASSPTLHEWFGYLKVMAPATCFLHLHAHSSISLSLIHI